MSEAAQDESRDASGADRTTMRCPSCGLVLDWSGEHVGAMLQCTCGAYFEVPARAGAPGEQIKARRDQTITPALRPCPRCLRIWPPNVTVCTVCGLDRRTGMTVKVEREPDVSQFRAGGIETEQERRERIRRDYHRPTIVLAVALLGIAHLTARDAGPLGLLFVPVWAAATAVLAYGIAWMMNRIVAIDFGALDTAMLKLTALLLAVHVGRGICLNVAELPTELPAAGGIGTAFYIVIVGLTCFILVPATALFVLVKMFWEDELDAQEHVVVTISFLAPEMMVFAAMKYAALPG